MTSLAHRPVRHLPPMLRRLGLVGILAWPAAMLPGIAHAQLSMGGAQGAAAASGMGKHGGGDDDDADKKPAAPDVIPGARANEPVVPASKSATELEPNAALFDAIDRGDLTAAREAVNRGADLNAKNVLGQRPIDMSIDLSRNDITFLLLSMRAQNGDEAPADEGDDSGAAFGSSGGSATKTASSGTHHGRHHHEDDTDVASTDTGGSGSGATTEEMSVRAAAPATPQPSAGFLGFGSH